MNEYKFEHCIPALEKHLKGIKEPRIYLPGTNQGEVLAWAYGYFDNVSLVSGVDRILLRTPCDISFINEDMKPYELAKLLFQAYDNTKIGGHIVCNHFYENRPEDEFEANPRYGIDAFSFLVQHRTDVLFKGNQIILRKLG